MTTMHLIAHWNPEDAAFWRGPGRRVAQRNLVLSVATLMLACAVWMLWSVVVVHLPAAGFRFSINQLFWLAALPALSGATLRVVYAFAVPMFGGRRWTALSTASLLLPSLGMGYALGDPTTPYEVLVGLALLCGLGGGNFASSMAHVGCLYPRHRVGWALGLNAGLGNLGITLAQALVPVVVTVSLFGALGGAPTTAGLGDSTAPLWLQNAGFVWVPLIVAGSLAAWFGMNDIAEARSTFGEQAVVFKRRDTWLTCWLYLATFGSFIGFAAALPLLLAGRYPGSAALQWAWLGPLVGAVLRPAGGWLSDRFGGARVTLASLTAMLLGALVLLLGVIADDGGMAAAGAGSAAAGGPVASAPTGVIADLAALFILFAAAGIGSSSVFRMIPLIFARRHERTARAVGRSAEAAARQAHTEAAAALGLSSAIAAYGGFVIPKSFGTALQLSGSAAPALVVFAVFYLSCIALTWRHYARPGAALPC